jgi:hypothetical protein
MKNTRRSNRISNARKPRGTRLGQRFLINDVNETSAPVITVGLNSTADLKKELNIAAPVDERPSVAIDFRAGLSSIPDL